MAWIKKTSLKDGLAAFTIADGDGKINIKATMSRFETFLNQTAGKQEADVSLILACIADLFSTFKGTRINVDGIKSMVITRMGNKVAELKNPSLYGSLSKRVAEVLKENTGEEGSGKLYGKIQGAGGGHFAWADQKK